MRRIRNIQQRRLMNKYRLMIVFMARFLSSACTRTPVEYRENGKVRAAIPSAVSEKLTLVANAQIGSSLVYTDAVTGIRSEIKVQSEYFSANGRVCRRFVERSMAAGSSVPRLSCMSDKGWIEIPVAEFAG